MDRSPKVLVARPQDSLDPMPVLRDALDRCVDALVEIAVTSGNLAGWLSWELGPEGQPRCMIGGRTGLYDGDAGVMWALIQLSAALNRSDLLDLAIRAGRNVLRNIPRMTSEGLLDGRAGVILGLTALSSVAGDTTFSRAAGLLERPAVFASADLTSGTAGLLLVQARTCSVAEQALEAVHFLKQEARIDPHGSCWPDRNDPDARTARPLCGLAHGNSGMALALAEAAAVYPGCASEAAALATEAIKWESAWFDPLEGNWPDLRGDVPSFPALWCHGAAGIGVARLRMLQLYDKGGGFGVPVETIRAEAEVAVQACGKELLRAADGSDSAKNHAPGGLTLCHGLGGPLDVLIMASEIWNVHSHLEAARYFAARIIRNMGPDPMLWPTGVRAPGSAGLFVGMAGTAMILARLVHPDRGVASPSLFVQTVP